MGQKDLAIKKNIDLMNKVPSDPLTIEIMSEFLRKLVEKRNQVWCMRMPLRNILYLLKTCV